MRKSRFTEHQIIAILKEVEQGRAVKDVCREHSVSEATCYQWKSKYGGMQASDIKRLRALEEENCRLQQLHGLSERQACRAVGLARSAYRYRARPDRDQEVIDALLELAHRKPEYSFGKLFETLRRRGHGWNHKRVYRLYCALRLNKRRKGKRRLPSRNPEPLAATRQMNECWSADFMSDALWHGRRFRTFNVVDDFNREGLAIAVDLNLPAPRVVRVLERVAGWRGYPRKLRLDNGPELVAVALAQWAESHGVKLEFIEPGKPMQNGFIERFNRSYREAVLDMYIELAQGVQRGASA